jgi:hypothetical protein
MGVVNQVTVITVNGVEMPGGNVDLTIPGGSADPETGEITFPSSTATEYVENFTLTAQNILDKFLLVTTDITSDEATKFEVQKLAPQFYGEDFEVDATNKKKVTWQNLGLESLLIEGDKITIRYF